LTIRAAQASSFVFSPAGIVLEKATPKLRTSGQRVHALIGRLVDLLCVPKTLNPTIVVMKSAKDGA
jgi:hypothetical protein